MRKIGVCAIAAALLIATGGVSEAQAAMLPVNTSKISCDTIEELKDKLLQMNGCENIRDFISKWNCGNLPELPEETPEVTPEVQDQAYAYGLRITELVNEHRAAAGLAPVTYSAKLSQAAQVRAVEIEQSFSHTRPDGRYFSTVFAEHGITYRYSGENIAWGQKSPEEVVTAWMNSAGHRANILNANFKELGVGYRQNARGVNYFTQLFIY